MSHSSTSRRRTTRRRRRASRIGSPAGPQAAAERPAHVDPLAAAVALRSSGPPGRGRDAQPRHQPVEPCELVGLERVEALGAEQLLVAGQHGHGARSSGGVGCGAGPGRRMAPRPRTGASGLGAAPALVRRRRLGLRVLRRPAPRSAAGPAEHGEENRVERAHLRAVGNERRPGGPVQPPARDRLDRPPAPARTRRRARP